MARKGKQTYDNLVYDLFLWIFNVVIDVFFREVHPRSSWKIPRKGPVIFVAAPHANQFVDPLILMRVVRNDARRRIAFLIAEKSMKRPVVGFLAGLVGSVPVGRALDSKKSGKGLIYMPDAENEPLLIKGNGVDFKNPQFMPGGTIILPSIDGTSASAEIKEILSATELRLKKEFKGEDAVKQLTGKLEQDSGDFQGIAFSVAPHVDQSAVYDAVFKRISEGGCIGIFPEGGSHDRTELLPLKAGLAITALGALAEDPNCDVSIVPVGMNYFHAHKFRSRAVVEFGDPIKIPPDVLEQYKTDNRREAVTHVLSEVQDALKSVTMQAPDYDTLFLIQAVRRLYNPKGKRLPLPMVIELQRRFLKGYEAYKDDRRIIALKKSILDWHKQLRQLNIRDHQLSYAKLPWWKVLAYFTYRFSKLALLSIAVIPGLILFSPVFIAGKIISRQKSKEALAASTVKVRARDVVATWKILVSLALGPTLDVIYTVIGTYWTYYDRVGGRVPSWLPLWLIAIALLILFPLVCFAALRFGEIGMDIFKSLRPLLLCLNPTSSNTLVKLRVRRTQLQEEITSIVNELGPELFPDFDHHRIISDDVLSPTKTPTSATTKEKQQQQQQQQSLLVPPPAQPVMRRSQTTAVDHIPRSESFQDISSVGVFSSRPTTPTHKSRNPSSDGFGLRGFTKLEPMTASNGNSSNNNINTTQTDMDEVSRNLRAAMRERGHRRKSSGEESWVMAKHDERDELRRNLAESEDMEPEQAKKDL